MTYSIGEVAKMLRVSNGSLRTYEKQGLIPKPQRRPTGHREYTDEDVKAIQEFLSKK
ncbi:MerR family DNA-binding transcriptional regulator [Chloroflexota bacterium]